MICTKIVLSFILLGFWFVFIYIRYKGFWYTNFFIGLISFILLKILKTMLKPYRSTVYPYNYTTKFIICQ